MSASMRTVTTSYENAVAELEDLVPELARLKRAESSAKRELGKLEREIAAAFGAKLVSAKARLLMAQTERAEMDAAVRTVALSQFVADGDKKPHPAVTIKINKALLYKPADALDYCREHLPKALKLDKRAFEKAARVIEPDFVEIVDDPKPFVARDLEKYL